MSHKVVNTQQYLTDEARDHMVNNGCRVEDCDFSKLAEQEFCSAILGVEGVIAGGERYTPKVFQAADKLRVIARTGVGVDAVDLESASKHGVQVTNTPGATSDAVADFTIGLVLSLLRKIPSMMQGMKDGKWNQFRGRELGAIVLGVVGAGSIGKAVIRRAHGFGTRILAHDIAPDEEFARKWNVQYVPLDDLMARSDVVTLHCSLNEETRGLIDERRLRLMKKDAYLVNTSRAWVPVKDDLIKVLREGAIAGAAIDVHESMPCDPADPLVMLDNVIATPSVAYSTRECVARMCITAATDLVTVLHGGAPRFPVNNV